MSLKSSPLAPTCTLHVVLVVLLSKLSRRRWQQDPRGHRRRQRRWQQQRQQRVQIYLDGQPCLGMWQTSKETRCVWPVTARCSFVSDVGRVAGCYLQFTVHSCYFLLVPACRVLRLGRKRSALGVLPAWSVERIDVRARSRVLAVWRR